MKSAHTALTLAVLAGLTSFTAHAAAEGRLVVYCSAQNTMCEQETLAFEKKYGIKTSFIRGGTGSILAKIDAEKDNPQGDVWYGGTLDPHSQAGEMGLLEPYKSPNLQYIPDSLKDPAKRRAIIPPPFISAFSALASIPSGWQNLICPCPNAGKI